MNIYNNQTYKNNNPSWHEEDASFKAAKILSIITKNSISFDTVCEIGCGSGEILLQLMNKLPSSIHYQGIDISQDAIKIAKTKERNRLTFNLNEFSEIKNERNFDLILVIDVIEHVENYFELLKEINHTSTYSIFHIPLDMSVWTLFREKMLIESKERVGHIHNFTEDFILSILTDYGFKIIDKIYTEPIDKPTKWKEKLVGLIRKTLFKIHPKFCTKSIGGYSLLVLCENKK